MVQDHGHDSDDRMHAMGFDGQYFGVLELDVMLPTEAMPLCTKVE
jgi:hypothetical protein